MCSVLFQLSLLREGDQFFFSLVFFFFFFLWIFCFSPVLSNSLLLLFFFFFPRLADGNSMTRKQAFTFCSEGMLLSNLPYALLIITLEFSRFVVPKICGCPGKPPSKSTKYLKPAHQCIFLTQMQLFCREKIVISRAWGTYIHCLPSQGACGFCRTMLSPAQVETNTEATSIALIQQTAISHLAEVELCLLSALQLRLFIFEVRLQQKKAVDRHKRWQGTV